MTNIKAEKIERARDEVIRILALMTALEDDLNEILWDLNEEPGKIIKLVQKDR